MQSVCWDNNGEYIASVSQDLVKVWSISSGECIHELSSNGNKFHCCVFHPSYSDLLVIGGYQVTMACLLNVFPSNKFYEEVYDAVFWYQNLSILRCLGHFCLNFIDKNIHNPIHLILESSLFLLPHHKCVWCFRMGHRN